MDLLFVLGWATLYFVVLWIGLLCWRAHLLGKRKP